MRHQTIEEAISAHESRNSELLRLFSDKHVDLGESRTIECHFWTWSRDDAFALATGLRNRGFRILTQTPAALTDDPHRWNIEGEIRQSIDLTMRREFIDELVRLAHSHNAAFDGWGTRI